ncbi:alpha-mannosidase [Erysipelothrix sp. P66]|uniref:alpha-mannosidase n=1 Tax=Erysipelothrix sp. P66 TaxID=3141531 RepID=UPI00315C7C45
MKKIVHIISHSHWDREWYLPYEQHHMRLVELIDDLLDLFKTDPEFKSFHLDGQTIPLDDYLAVRPHRRQEVLEATQSGKLKVGPFYILQDDFLISAEANTRNMLVGLDESKQWGEPVMLGYFPDTFGNMGQAPQLMKQADIHAVAYGRGVKTTGFNNVVVDETYVSNYSELMWEGADKTEIFSILFANWYSNGNEIPVEKEAAQAFWDQKLADVEKYASTRHLLMMNGVDHQPVQKDVTKAIRTARELYPDYEFIHSNFDDYLEAVMAELPDDLGRVKGELTSQETDGWYTLANTSSARVYLKQKNTEVQNLLELVAEPLATMAMKADYPHDMLRYAWKTLMQNHPHDSICGCSVDAVHRQMMTRFENAEEVGLYVRDLALDHLEKQMDTSMFPKASRPFTIFNTLGVKRHETVTVTLEWERLNFNREQPDHLYKQLEARVLPPLCVQDEQGNTVQAEILDTWVQFDYDLPKDGFRVPYMSKRIKVRMSCELPALSWKSFALVEGEHEPEHIEKPVESNTLENHHLKVTIHENGTVDVYDKVNHKSYLDVFYYDDAGDIGNEYIFKQPYGDQTRTSRHVQAHVEVLERSPLIQRIAMTQNLEIPVSADETLLYEQISVTEMRQRTAQRSLETAPLTLTTEFTLEANSPVLKIETRFTNEMKDHRLRACFDVGFKTSHHQAESIYEVVTRPNAVSKSWENPSNPQHQQAFCGLYTQDQGVVVGNIGLNEYEIINNDTMAVTLLRSVGEMGDWGYFPTPEAQCLGDHQMTLYLACHGKGDRVQTYQAVKAKHVGFQVKQCNHHKGNLAPTQTYLNVTSQHMWMTALKRNEHGEDPILRLYNMESDAGDSLEVSFNQYTVIKSDVLERDKGHFDGIIKPAEIVTLRFKEEDAHETDR